MPALRMGLALVLAVALLGQLSVGLQERIQRAPLTQEERQTVTTSFALKNFDRLEALLAGNVANRALLGALEFVGGRMIQAVQAFRQADALSPLDDPDRFTLAMALVDLGDVEASRSELKRLHERRPDQVLYLYWLARLDYGLRRYDDAVDQFKKVISLDPGSIRGYDNLGLTYDMMGLNEEAQAAFAQAAVLNRKLLSPSPWPPHNLGYLQLRLQKFADAEKNLRESLQYDPKFALAHYHLARVLEKEDRTDPAIEEYRKAADLDGKLAEPLYSLGLLCRRHGREAEAVSALAEYRRRKGLTSASQ